MAQAKKKPRKKNPALSMSGGLTPAEQRAFKKSKAQGANRLELAMWDRQLKMLRAELAKAKEEQRALLRQAIEHCKEQRALAKAKAKQIREEAAIEAKQIRDEARGVCAVEKTALEEERADQKATKERRKAVKQAPGEKKIPAAQRAREQRQEEDERIENDLAATDPRALPLWREVKKNLHAEPNRSRLQIFQDKYLSNEPEILGALDRSMDKVQDELDQHAAEEQAAWEKRERERAKAAPKKRGRHAAPEGLEAAPF